jgi:hypothetical protein
MKLAFLDGCTSVLSFQALRYYNFHTVFLFLIVKQYRYREEISISIHTDRKRNRAWGPTFFRRYNARAFSKAVAIANACIASQE